MRIIIEVGTAKQKVVTMIVTMIAAALELAGLNFPVFVEEVPVEKEASDEG